jgi:hypothetical protein
VKQYISRRPSGKTKTALIGLLSFIAVSRLDPRHFLIEKALFQGYSKTHWSQEQFDRMPYAKSVPPGATSLVFPMTSLVFRFFANRLIS